MQDKLRNTLNRASAKISNDVMIESDWNAMDCGCDAQTDISFIDSCMERNGVFTVRNEGFCTKECPKPKKCKGRCKRIHTCKVKDQPGTYVKDVYGNCTDP